jgi:hypothetical protein
MDGEGSRVQGRSGAKKTFCKVCNIGHRTNLDKINIRHHFRCQRIRLMGLRPTVSGRETNGNEIKRGESHVDSSRPATMEQKDAYSLDVCDGDGRQVS